MKKIINSSSKSFGGNLIEAAITLPILLALVLFLVDGVSYLTKTLGANYAAYRGADLASKYKLDVVTDGSSCKLGGAQPMNKDCEQYAKRVRAVLDEVERIGKLLVGENNLVEYRMYDRSAFSAYGYNVDADVPPMTARAFFIRPGEVAVNVATGEVKENSRRPPAASPSSASACANSKIGLPQGLCGENWASVLDNTPVEIGVTATYRPMTPFFFKGTFEVRGNQQVYRKEDTRGNPMIPPILPTQTVTPIPTPTFVFAAATATPVPTETPSPTATSTATATATPTATATYTPWPTNTPTSTPTITPTATPTHTATPIPTATATATPAPTATTAPTATPVSTATPVGTATPAPTPTFCLEPGLYCVRCKTADLLATTWIHGCLTLAQKAQHFQDCNNEGGYPIGSSQVQPGFRVSNSSGTATNYCGIAPNAICSDTTCAQTCGDAAYCLRDRKQCCDGDVIDPFSGLLAEPACYDDPTCKATTPCCDRGPQNTIYGVVECPTPAKAACYHRVCDPEFDTDDPSGF